MDTSLFADKVSCNIEITNYLRGERMGWWSFWKTDRRTKITALIMGAAIDARTKIILDIKINA